MPEVRQRNRISRLLLQEINDQFPGVGSLRGIPGLWEDWQGVHLWKSKDSLLPRLLIPVRDGSGRIQACQMRLPIASKKGMRYLWLSSSDLPHGTGSGSPLHFKFHLAYLPRDARIVFVEGVLKAEVLSAIRHKLYIVATPCVTANHNALIELTHGRPVWIAFDQDHYSNETSAFTWPRSSPTGCGAKGRSRTTRIASWDVRVRGIDDAAGRNLPITSISVQRWLNRLSPRFRQIAMTRLSEIATFPLRSKNRSGSQGR